MIRRLIFIVMIALLPLQGWTHAAMSTEMAAMKFSSSHSQGAAASMAMSPECALRMSSANPQNAESNDIPGKVCSDCQACHLIALAEAVQPMHKIIFRAPFERPAPKYFASADLSLTQKPPIFSA